MYAGWTITEEAITGMENLAAKLEEIQEGITTEVTNLTTVFEENEDGLGPHSDSIRSVLEELLANAETAGKPVKLLAFKLRTGAQLRRDVLGENNYQKSR